VREQTLSQQFFFSSLKKKTSEHDELFERFYSLDMVEISESLICLKSSTYIVCRLEEKRKKLPSSFSSSFYSVLLSLQIEYTL